ncbi:MAG: RNA 3'-phosphate cyclase, partial [Deltaproteobacteria bacterium]|nr:RNA 3'-phosphate cyclase [Deltaproteobacteria bacterium]
MINIDGSSAHGGGQLIRTALALSLLSGKPFRISSVRREADLPGLLRRHLTTIRACEAIGDAEISGADLGSVEFAFSPRGVRGGEFLFRVGSAGSVMLLLQTILLPLLSAEQPSRVVIEGGTHIPGAPTFDLVARSYLPILHSLGATVEMTLERPGFYPAGGGRVVVDIIPSRPVATLQVLERGALLAKRVRAVVAGLPGEIGKRELAYVRSKTNWAAAESTQQQLPHECGPGNLVVVELAFENVTSVFASFGDKGILAEHVAEAALSDAEDYLAHRSPVSEHLAELLLLSCAWTGGGEFRTRTLSGA